MEILEVKIMEKTTADILIQEASKFEAAAQKLREAANILKGNLSPEKMEIQPSKNNGDKELKISRKEQLKKFLKNNGPSTRHVILTESGIPNGTIANLLSKDKDFTLNKKNGKWHYIDKKLHDGVEIKTVEKEVVTS